MISASSKGKYTVSESHLLLNHPHAQKVIMVPHNLESIWMDSYRVSVHVVHIVVVADTLFTEMTYPG